jgi:threonine synthase
MADSIDVKVPRNWRKAVRAVRDSNGEIITASDDAILDAMRLAGRHGVFAEPAAAAALAGVVAALDCKMIAPQERVLVMITGSGLKDTRSAIRAAGRPIAIEPTVVAVEHALEVSRKGAKEQRNH